MKVRAQLARWSGIAGLLLAMFAAPSVAQRRNDQRSAPQPSHQQSRPSYSQPRSQPHQQPQSQSRPQQRESPPQPRPESRPQVPSPQATQRDFRNYRPPTEGHHFGQWLNQHRDQPLDQQRRALQNDPQFRHLPPQRQQQYVQSLQQHFNSLPPERQQQVLRRGEVWEHLKPQQRQEFRNFASQYNSLPPDRRQAVKNAIQTLRAMPPEARQRELQSGRFGQFSPQERQMLNDASNLPLAPAQSNTNQAEPPRTGPQRYVPRPPH